LREENRIVNCEEKDVVNREEVNWFQTIADAETTEHFVLALYERRRISLQVMADVARERGSTNRSRNQFRTTATRRTNEYPATELPVAIPSEEPMSAQSLQNYNTNAAFVYGSGADYDLSKHFTLRAEYRGFVYERPDFGLVALHPRPRTRRSRPRELSSGSSD
jgi:opacity protein-like surface antigen